MNGSKVRAGQRVITADGEELGSVKEVAAASFKVDAPMALDYWLPIDAVVVQQPGEDLVTAFARDRLADHIIEPPDDVLLV
jgi:hypothetical protein